LIFLGRLGVPGKLAPVRKSFDLNPLETLVPASLTYAKKGNSGAYPAM
jgi:hypothetical protein